jgi:hypothetical protein
MRTVTLVCSLAVLTGLVVSLPTPSGATAAPPVKIRTAADFPDGLKEFAGPLGAFDTLKAALENPPEKDMDERFRKPGPHRVHRYEWLRAERRNLDHYDYLARLAVGHEKHFRLLYAASTHPGKDFVSVEAIYFQDFQQRRLTLRYSWWYIARMHHWAWEAEGPILPRNERLFISVSKGLGLTTEQLGKILAWGDLLVSDFMPGIIPPLGFLFRLMS